MKTASPHRTEPTIRLAKADESRLLSALAFRSKAHWGYTAEFMEACRAELSVSAAYMNEHVTLVVELLGTVIGFYSLEPLSEEKVELGYLFVEPAEIGRGYGRRLVEHAKTRARRDGYRVLVIQGDPHAAAFYHACGAKHVGAKVSASIPGRMLPLLEIELL